MHERKSQMCIARMPTILHQHQRVFVVWQRRVAQTAEQTLQEKGAIKPTLIIHQDTSINVFVARDLYFQKTLSNQNPS